jgi:hypothetical protein
MSSIKDKILLIPYRFYDWLESGTYNERTRKRIFLLNMLPLPFSYLGFARFALYATNGNWIELMNGIISVVTTLLIPLFGAIALYFDVWIATFWFTIIMNIKIAVYPVTALIQPSPLVPVYTLLDISCLIAGQGNLISGGVLGLIAVIINAYAESVKPIIPNTKYVISTPITHMLIYILLSIISGYTCYRISFGHMQEIERLKHISENLHNVVDAINNQKIELAFELIDNHPEEITKNILLSLAKNALEVRARLPPGLLPNFTSEESHEDPDILSEISSVHSTMHMNAISSNNLSSISLHHPPQIQPATKKNICVIIQIQNMDDNKFIRIYEKIGEDVSFHGNLLIIYTSKSATTVLEYAKDVTTMGNVVITTSPEVKEIRGQRSLARFYPSEYILNLTKQLYMFEGLWIDVEFMNDIASIHTIKNFYGHYDKIYGQLDDPIADEWLYVITVLQNRLNSAKENLETIEQYYNKKIQISNS